jgi:hypothetical protein
VPRCGTPDEALDAHGLSAGRLAEAVRAWVHGTANRPDLHVVLRQN